MTLRPQRSFSRSLVVAQPIPLNQSRSSSEQEIVVKQVKARQNFQKLKRNLNVIAQTPRIPRSIDQKRKRKKPQNRPSFEPEEYMLQLSQTSSDLESSGEDNSLARSNIRKLHSQNQSLMQNQKNSELVAMEEIEKVQLNFIRSLPHNHESKDVEEFYEDGLLKVNLCSYDIFAFMRYEHEIEEMVRRSQTLVDNRLSQEEMVKEEKRRMEEKELKEQENQKKQREIISELLVKEMTKKTQYLRSKTRKVDNIAMKFIDENKQKAGKKSFLAPETHFIERKKNQNASD